MLPECIARSCGFDMTDDQLFKPQSHFSATHWQPLRMWWWWIKPWVTEVIQAKSSHPHCPIKEWQYMFICGTTGGVFSLGVIWAKPRGHNVSSQTSWMVWGWGGVSRRFSRCCVATGSRQAEVRWNGESASTRLVNWCVMRCSVWRKQLHDWRPWKGKQNLKVTYYIDSFVFVFI